jgi:3-hydroxymyristoyl/3-hydroxydecanoyl-(acyl carrier protein) dehydratase
MREQDALKAGLPILATLPAAPRSDALVMGPAPGHLDLTPRLGHAHAASGMVHLAGAVLACRHGLQPAVEGPAAPWPHRHAVVSAGGRLIAVAGNGDTAPLPSPNADIRRLQLPAHPAAIVLPPPPRAVQPTPAPAPPTAAPARAAEPTPQPTPTPSTQVEPPTPTGPPAATGADPRTGHLQSAVGVSRQVAATHAEYLAQQARVHSRFLAMRESALHGLATMLRTVPDTPRAARASAPASPAPAPPQPPTTKGPAPIVLSLPQMAPPLEPSASADPGPRWSRAQLQVLSQGKISSVFGPMFSLQDDFPRQVRMPEPPLLLADRTTGLAAAAGSMETGTIWSESDIHDSAWYLHDNRIPSGILIESGQADLLLISWLGADFQNRGKRVYRLLGCTLTYRGGLPQPGDTVRYDIHVDGHADQGDTRLFFFHYDCSVNGQNRLEVRGGQAGFFSDEELAGSGGVLWSSSDHTPSPALRLDPPKQLSVHRHFDEAQVRAFATGNPADCFGAGFEALTTPPATPRIPAPPLLFFDRIDDLDPAGGPWGRGYLRATQHIRPSDWFFDGHFKDDPCMAGTLMFEACLAAAGFYLAALGYTLDRDGWHFEPVSDIPYALRCRGQVTPSSTKLVCEVFVEEVHDGPWPTVYADFLGTIDTLRAFHARRVGVQLRPGAAEPIPVASACERAGQHLERLISTATAEGHVVVELSELRLPNEPPAQFRVDIDEPQPHHLVATLLAFHDDADPALQQFQPYGSARPRRAVAYPPPPPVQGVPGAPFDAAQARAMCALAVAADAAPSQLGALRLYGPPPTQGVHHVVASGAGCQLVGPSGTVVAELVARQG